MHWQSGTYTHSRDPSGLKEARASLPDRPRGQRGPSRGAESWPLGEPDARVAVNQLPPAFFFFSSSFLHCQGTLLPEHVPKSLTLVMIRVVRVYVGMCVRGTAAATERPPPRWADADKRQTSTPALQYSLRLFSCTSSERKRARDWKTPDTQTRGTYRTHAHHNIDADTDTDTRRMRAFHEPVA